MARKQAPLERNFQARFLRRLRQIPRSWWVKVNDKATIGVPDILGFVNGYGFALELKTKSKLSELQHYTLNIIDSRARAQSFVVTPENAEEILAYIAAFNSIPAPPTASLRRPARMPMWVLPPGLRVRNPTRA